jgi:hypothetical protein
MLPQIASAIIAIDYDSAALPTVLGTPQVSVKRNNPQP